MLSGATLPGGLAYPWSKINWADVAWSCRCDNSWFRLAITVKLILSVDVYTLDAISRATVFHHVPCRLLCIYLRTR